MRWLCLLGLFVSLSASVSAQTVCSAPGPCTVLRNEPFSAAADDTVNTSSTADGYRLYLNNQLSGTLPFSAKVGTAITFAFPSGIATAGTYSLTIAAYNVDVDGTTAETPSAALSLVVRTRKLPPGQVTNLRIITANR